jgi:hypothetical protein
MLDAGRIRLDFPRNRDFLAVPILGMIIPKVGMTAK